MRPARRRTPLRDLTTYGRGRALRLPGCDYIGNIDIHVTLCADREAPFRIAGIAAMVCDNVEFYCRKLGYRLYGLTLMPDHLHVLLSPAKSERPLAYWLDVFKSYTTNRYMKMGYRPPLWQPSANDHVCRTAETAVKVLTYIVNNPVRAEMVQVWQEWPWTKIFVEL
jgi:putative transposase